MEINRLAIMTVNFNLFLETLLLRRIENCVPVVVNVTEAIDDICLHYFRQGSGASQLQYLLLCMPCIRQVDSSLRRFWAAVRRDSRVPMNKLFLEMLESPIR